MAGHKITSPSLCVCGREAAALTEFVNVVADAITGDQLYFVTVTSHWRNFLMTKSGEGQEYYMQKLLR